MSTEELTKQSVIDELAFDSRVDASNISVKVDNKTVKLEGTVPTYSSKIAAENDAFSIPDVYVVENNLDVKFETPPEIPSDKELKTQLMDILIWNTSIDTTKIEIEVKNQWVTLKGDVDSYWKKYLAEEKALNLHGVVGVTNEIAVVPTEKMTDEAIAEDIVKSIERNINVIADNVTVKVKDANVTLTGEVRDWGAKNSAFMAAASAWGVKEVKNKIVISP